jgi:ABC-type antimicrobial peptide transport system permease subunit
MGAGNSPILAQFILEGMLLCLISVVIALAISMFALAPVSNAILPTVDHRIPCLSILPNGTRWLDVEFTTGYASGDIAPVSVTPELMLFTIGLALLLGAVGSLYPALKAARTKPAEAMRYE